MHNHAIELCSQNEQRRFGKQCHESLDTIEQEYNKREKMKEGEIGKRAEKGQDQKNKKNPRL